jgi:putative hydrolase
MSDLGKRIEFHSHTNLSDGLLLPAGLVYEAAAKGHQAIVITDHIDASNIEFVISSLTKFIKEQGASLPIETIPGVEVSYIAPELIEKYANLSKQLGAKLIIVHGESPVEPVPKGTNHAALKLKGLVDILAHPGEITEEDAALAAQNDIYLELSARKGHRNGNKHVAKMAKKTGAKLLVNTDTHSEKDLITQADALKIAKNAGLNNEEAICVVKENPLKLINKIGCR